MPCLAYHILVKKSDEASRGSIAKAKKILMIQGKWLDLENEETLYWEYYPKSLLFVLSAWFLAYMTLF